MLARRLMPILLALLMAVPAVAAACDGLGACCPAEMGPASFSAPTCCPAERCVVRSSEAPPAAPSARFLPSTFPGMAAPVAPYALSTPAFAKAPRIRLFSVRLPILHAQLLI